MKAVRLLPIALSFLLLTGCAWEAAAPAQAEEAHTVELLAMDTIMRITVYGPDGQKAADQAADRILELEDLLSTTDTGSEIYGVNHSGGAPAALSGDTVRLLDQALTLCESTGGALDVTIYPVVRAWGFTTGACQVPGGDELAGLLEQVDYREVALEGSVLTLPRGAEIDLGAVAKGYTGDQVAALLLDAGVTSALLELGGNIQTVGAKPDGTPWRVAVQAPEGGYAGVLEVEDKAVVTSGGYERYFEQDGEIYWHIIDPATGYPAQSGLTSVTIISDRGVEGDGLSTALFVMGAEKAASYWRENGGFDFVLIDEEGGVTITEGIEDSFSLYGEWTDHDLTVLRP